MLEGLQAERAGGAKTLVREEAEQQEKAEKLPKDESSLSRLLTHYLISANLIT